MRKNKAEMNRLKITNVLFFYLLMMSSLIGQEQGDQYLKSLQDKFNSIKDFNASFNQSIGGKSSLSGKLFFKKENNFRIELGNSTIVSDGATSWNFNKKENKVIITNYEEDGSLFSINFLVYQFPNQCTVTGELDGNLRKLTLIPKSRTSNLGEVVLWINNDSLIEKLQTNDPASGLIELNFSNIKINQNLPVSNFQFTPPQGSRIIDLR
ncbi:MAG TPA: outer-membrane lipoprotein carrier protein LolA [Ignavibacteriaceae bacterium]|nr:outer-membrane lipoprotein carrier protein LolA [Ignavibacteriaceae bacterium]